MKYSGHGKIVGIRYKNPSLEENEETQDFYIDVMINEKDIFRNLHFNIKESLGEIPSLGLFCWVLINEKEMKIIDID